MNYKSKPHTLQAFQFKMEPMKPPEWFTNALETGRVMVTLSSRHGNYITIYDGKGGVRKAHEGDWVCINLSNTIFPMTDEEFTRGFELDA